ncbi:MAG: hypothetical protein E7013_00050 [Alphaproteobacteria bacterium]|nr:hypothetical protein [Alphaproteobacteria bacterium]
MKKIFGFIALFFCLLILPFILSAYFLDFSDLSSSESNLNGVIKTYYDSGHLFSQITYKNGLRHGAEIIYHENGNVSRTAEYKSDVKIGEEKTYYKNGLLKSHSFYKAGLKDGESKTFYNDNDFSKKEPRQQALVIFKEGKAIQGSCFNVITNQNIEFNKAHLHNFEIDMSTPCDITRTRKVEEEGDDK